VDFQSRKISDFNLEQAEIISAKLSKITTHCQSFKDDDTMVDESIDGLKKF
jgi:glutamyl-tRNA reductase